MTPRRTPNEMCMKLFNLIYVATKITHRLCRIDESIVQNEMCMKLFNLIYVATKITHRLCRIDESIVQNG